MVVLLPLPTRKLLGILRGCGHPGLPDLVITPHGRGVTPVGKDLLKPPQQDQAWPAFSLGWGSIYKTPQSGHTPDQLDQNLPGCNKARG